MKNETKEDAVRGKKDPKPSSSIREGFLEWRDANQSGMIERCRELCGLDESEFAVRMATLQRRRRVGAYTV